MPTVMRLSTKYEIANETETTMTNIGRELRTIHVKLPTSSPTIVDPAKAPIGKEPRLLGVDHIEPELDSFRHQRYRTEAWKLNNGETVVIVSDNGGTSLMNASEGIAVAINDRWHELSAPFPIIIEDWSEETPYGTGERFRISDRDGGSESFDFDKWDRVGLVLPRP